MLRLPLLLVIATMSSIPAVVAEDDALEEACFVAIGGEKLATDVIIRSEQAGQVVTLHVVSKDQTTSYDCEFLSGGGWPPQLVGLVMTPEGGASTSLPIEEPNRRIAERFSH